MARGRRSSNRRETPRRRTKKEAVPDVYAEMVAEAMSSAPTSLNTDDRATKRRRVGDQVQTREVENDYVASNGEAEHAENGTPRPQVQTAYAESESSEEDEDDVGWEDVNLGGLPGLERETSDENTTENLDLVLDDATPSTTSRSKARVKPLSADERKLRLQLHKMHLLCLLGHVDLRNQWCSDIAVLLNLRRLLSDRIISYLNPNPNFSQFQKSRSFNDGLTQASELWRGKFMIEGRGLRKGTWRVPSNNGNETSLPNDFDDPLEEKDFIKLASDRKGSRDIGAQLFCALLRAGGVNARLVCSLQPLPLTFAPVSQTPNSTVPTNHQTGAAASGNSPNSANIHSHTTQVTSSGNGIRGVPQPQVHRGPGVFGRPTFGDGIRGRIGGTPPFVPGAAGRLGQPRFGVGIGGMERVLPPMIPDTPRRWAPPPSGPGIHGTIIGTPGVARSLGMYGIGPARTVASERAARGLPVNEDPPPRRRVKESQFPVYWVEAFDAAKQKWIPVDPLITKTVGKPSSFEPTGNDPENSMTYVVAFEDDGTVIDVTKRYTKAFIAKTRKMRVEITPGGGVWWEKTLKHFRRDEVLDRDQVEQAELLRRESQEPMPKNIQDFKEHPLYALERHLKKNEVIHPRTEVGKVAVGKAGGTAGSKRLEPIYRRRDVHKLKSASAWYRLGRDIKPGEQPLKHSAGRRKRSRSLFEDENLNSDGDGNGDTGMYAEFQTTLYEAPPIINGNVPKNSYGNIDLYVPSMVPKGGVHIPNDEAARAARLLGVDYADAVTGFEFKGRHGTAVIRGIVTAAENQEGIEAVIQGFKDEAARAEALKKRIETLRLWRRFWIGLKVHERIEGYAIEGEDGNVVSKAGTTDANLEDSEGGGGFFPNRDQEQIAEPTAGRFHFSEDEHVGGGFFPDADVPEIESVPRTQNDINSARDGSNLYEDAEESEDELGAPRRRGSRFRFLSRRDSRINKSAAANTTDEREGLNESESPFGESIPEGGISGGGFLIEGDIEDDKNDSPDDAHSMESGVAKTTSISTSPSTRTDDHATEQGPSSTSTGQNKPNNNNKKTNQRNPSKSSQEKQQQHQKNNRASTKRSRDETEDNEGIKDECNTISRKRRRQAEDDGKDVNHSASRKRSLDEAAAKDDGKNKDNSTTRKRGRDEIDANDGDKGANSSINRKRSRQDEAAKHGNQSTSRKRTGEEAATEGVGKDGNKSASRKRNRDESDVNDVEKDENDSPRRKRSRDLEDVGKDTNSSTSREHSRDEAAAKDDSKDEKSSSSKRRRADKEDDAYSNSTGENRSASNQDETDTATNEDGDKDEDVTSLLSHDPEDDDADPEWLLSE